MAILNFPIPTQIKNGLDPTDPGDFATKQYVDSHSGGGGGGSTYPGGSNTQVQFNNASSFGGSANFTFNRTTNVLNVTGNINANNANLGNIVIANYHSGSGNLLSNIQGANVTGFVPNANVANTAYAVAGANVTGAVSYATTANSVAVANVSGIGNIATINKDGNASNILYGNGVFASLPTSTYGNSNVATFLASYGSNTITTTGNVSVGNIIGNGQALTGLAGANVTGAVSYATTANSVAGSNVSGAVAYATTANSVAGSNVSGAVGLATYATTANSVAGANVSGAVAYATTANSVAVGNVSGIGNIATINKDGNASNVLYGNGVFATATTYGDSNVTTLLASFGSNTISTTGDVTVGNIIGNGHSLSGLVGANVTGAVAYATTANAVAGANVSGQVANALVAGTVYTAAQPNITSVGTLTSLTVAGNITPSTDVIYNLGNSTHRFKDLWLSGTTIQLGGQTISTSGGGIALSGPISGDGGSLSNIVGANVTGAVSYATTANSVAGANVSGEVSYAATANAVAGANVSGQVSNALVAGTVYTSAQPNITSVGTLSSLSVTGDISGANLTITGNLVVGGTTTSINSTVTRIVDPMIELGGGANGASLTSDDNKDRGLLLHYYSGSSTVNAFMGWDDSNVEFGVGSNISVTGEVVTWTEYGNLRANVYFGNGSQLTGVVADTAKKLANGTSNVDIATSSGNVTVGVAGNAAIVTVTGTGVNIAGYANLGSGNLITTGNLTSGNANLGNALTANYFIGSGNNLSNIQGANVSGAVGLATYATTANAVAGANVSGAVAYATTANSVAGANVSGAVSYATTANAVAGANVSGAVGLATYATTANAVAGANVSGQVNYAATANAVAGANVSGAVAYATTANSVAVANVSGIGNIATINKDGNASNILYGNGVFASAPAVYGNSNVATFLASFGSNTITTTGNIAAGNANLGNAATANYFIGTLYGNANLAGSVTTASQSNITSVGTLTGLTVSGLIIATATGIKTANIQDSTGTITITTKYNSNPGDVGITGNVTVGVGGAANITANGNVTANYFLGNGSSLSALTGANITGWAPNANNANYLGGVVATSYLQTTGTGSSLTAINGANVTGQVANALVAGTVYTAAQPSITSVGTLTTLVVGNSTANSTFGNGTIVLTSAGNITGGNLLSASYLSGVLTTASSSQPNITSVGTLTDLIISGNLTVGGTTEYVNVTTVAVKDPIIEQGGGTNNATLTSDDGKDRGTLLHYYTGGAATNAFMGWKNSGAEFIFGSSVTEASGVITVTNYGNVHANYYIGNGSQLTGVIADSAKKLANGTSNVDIATASGNITVGVGGTAGVVTITQTGVNVAGYANLGSGNLITTGNVTAGNIIGIIAAGSNAITTTGNISGGNANVTGQLISTLAAGTAPIVVTSTTVVPNLYVSRANVSDYSAVTAQTTGTFYPLFASGSTTANYALGANSSLSFNVATGNLGTTLLNVTSNANVGNLGFGSGTVTGTGNIVAGNANVTGQLISTLAVGTAPLVVTSTTRVANLNVAYANVSDFGAVTAQTTGTFYPLFASGSSSANYALGANANLSFNAATGNLSASILYSTGNITAVGNIDAGSNYFKGNGSLLTGITINNGTSNIAIPTLNGNINLTAGGTTSLVVTSTGANITGTANISGNANVGNLGFGSGTVTGTGNLVAGNANVTGQLISTQATGTAPLAVTSTTRVANLSVAYANVSDYGVVTTQTTGTFYPAFVSGSASGNYALASNSSLSFNAATGNLSATILNATGNANVGNLGFGSGTVTGTGNIVAGNANVTGQLISTVATSTAPLVVTSTTRVANLNVAYANVSDYGAVTAQTTGTFYPVFVSSSSSGNYAHGANSNLSFNVATGNLSASILYSTGNITAVGNIDAGSNYFKGNGSLLTGVQAVALSNGTSNVNISTSGGNIQAVVGSSVIANIASTGIVITGSANVSSQLISTVATGTAPLVITSTTRVANLNVAYANVSDYGNVTAQTTGTFYPVFASGSTSSNYALGANSSLSFNAATGNLNATILSATGNITGSNANVTGQLISTVATSTAPIVVTSTTRVANLNVAYANVSDYGAVTLQTTGTFYPIFASGSATANYAHAANANLSFNVATGNLNATILSATGNITGGNANVTGQLISTVATGTAPLAITSTTRVTNLNVAYANVSDYGAVTAQTTGTFYPVFTSGSSSANYALGANASLSFNAATGNLSATLLTGTLTTAAQTSVTSLGTLTGLTVSGNATFSGGWMSAAQSTEVLNTKTGATGVVAHDLSTGATFYHTSVAASFTANFTNVSTTDNRSIVVTIIIVQGGTAYIPSAVQIDGVAQTIKWPGGVAPTGTINAVDIFSFALIRTGGAWAQVLGSNSSVA